MVTRASRLVLVAVLLLLAGCNGTGGSTTAAPTLDGDPLGTQTPSNTAAAGESPGEDESRRAASPTTSQGRRVVELARANDVPVRSAVTRNGTFFVVYEVDAASEAAARQRGFTLAQAYATVVNETWTTNASWNASAMTATAITVDGTPVSTYRMPAYWGHRFRTSEVYDRPLFARDLDRATSRVYSNGSIANVTGNLTQFARGIQATQNGTVSRISRTGNTVYVTLATPTDNRSLLERRINIVTTVYGAFVTRGWDAKRIELTVRRPDGDIYGWYTIEDSVGREAYTARTGYAFVFDTFYPEHDGLDSDQ